MKKVLLLPLLIFILILIPAGILNADPGNLVPNGDFSDGLNNWDAVDDAILVGETVKIGPTDGSYIYTWNDLIMTSRKDLTFSADVNPEVISPTEYFVFGLNLYLNNSYIDDAKYESNIDIWITGWSTFSMTLSNMWAIDHVTPVPDFDEIRVYVQISNGCIAYFDNIKLTYPEATEEPVWVRTMPMTCWQVWINEDNNFQFIFWYPYKDENFIRIYDMEDNLVFETDLPEYDPNLIVDLPDGMYMVKTFHGLVPLQEFLIGKPGPEM